MVDVGNLYAIKEKFIFVGCPSTNNNVVAEAWYGGSAWQGTDYLADVAVAARAVPDFIRANTAERNRAIFCFFEWRGGYFNLLEAGAFFGKGKIYNGGPRIGYLYFVPGFFLKAQ